MMVQIPQSERNGQRWADSGGQLEREREEAVVRNVSSIRGGGLLAGPVA